jgi:arsenate reductase-like glutaredoxin family protein
VLAQAGVPLREHDFFKRRLTVDELRALLGGRPVADLFAWKSVVARRRGYQPGALDDETLLRLMAEEPTLIRRPFAVVDGRLVVGKDVAALASPHRA